MPLLSFISKNPALHFLSKVVILVLAAYIALCLLLFIAQRRMIYLPSRANAVLPTGFEPWLTTNASGATEFCGFKRLSPPATSPSTNALFFFHGNGGNASGWSHAVTEFPGDIFVLEYPGYGQRPGAPTERSLKSAALRAFEAEHHRYSKIILSGQSLGTGVTEAIFTKYPEKLHALVLITPFLSLAEVAGHHYSWIPTRLLLRDRLHLYDAYLEFPGRSLVVTAAEDEIIPRSHALRYHAATNANRALLELPASHNTIDLDRTFWQNILTGQTWK